jgi:hypothetical protein
LIKPVEIMVTVIGVNLIDYIKVKKN